MSDKRNVVNCAKCHNTKCTLSGKAFDMAVCTGYKRMNNYERLKAMSIEEMAAYLADHPLVRPYNPNNEIHKAWLEWLKRVVEDGKIDKQ